jgi:hypothetical protein
MAERHRRYREPHPRLVSMARDGGLVAFPLAALANLVAHLARVLAVEGLTDCDREGFAVGVRDQHPRPCDGLQNHPMAAARHEEGKHGSEKAGSAERGSHEVSAAK